MIKIEHSIFALPFAYMGLFMSSGGKPGFMPLLMLTVAMVAIRSFAMTVNRILDLDMDRINPRTSSRALVTGEVSVKFAVAFSVGCAVVFVLACAGLNTLCLALSPVALIWSAFYSTTKRFTWACHFVLGSVLGLAPVAGWIAFAPHISLASVLLFFGVTFWVAGFDILYSCQDYEFDREHGLNSLPSRFGAGPSLGFALFSHVNAVIFFLLAGWAAHMGVIYYISVLAMGIVLFFEHKLIKEDDLSRINLAFFTLNGVISVVLFAGALLDIYITR